MGRRIYKKYVVSCRECPAIDTIFIEKTGEPFPESWCNEYDKKIEPEYLEQNTQLFNFPNFCKLREER